MLGTVGTGARHWALTRAFPGTRANPRANGPALAGSAPLPSPGCLFSALQEYARCPVPVDHPEPKPQTDTCHAPGRAADQAREGSPRLKRVLSRRGGLGRFACRWLSHPSRSALEFLRRFQTQRLGARDTPGSVCQALPWEGDGVVPGELSPP